MRLNIYLEHRELLCALFPIKFPDDLKSMILRFSDHLRVGKRSISYVMYF